MTLEEAAKRARSVPKKGDFEFVRQMNGGDGLAHLFIVVDVQMRDNAHHISYMCRCGAIQETSLDKLEVADQVTCLPCMI